MIRKDQNILFSVITLYLYFKAIWEYYKGFFQGVLGYVLIMTIIVERKTNQKSRKSLG